MFICLFVIDNIGSLKKHTMYGYVGYEWGRHMMRWWVHSLLVLGKATRFLGSPIPFQAIVLRSAD